MTKIIKPIMRYHGAKFRLAPWVISMMPPHTVYTEAFGGSAAILLQKPRAYAEVYNDLDTEIVNVFRVLRDPELWPKLRHQCELTPYARDEFLAALEPTEDPIEKARRTLVRAYMGFGSGSATRQQTGFRIDTRRKYGTAAHNWIDYPPHIENFAKRLEAVIIENRPATDIIQQHDSIETLHYVDPPYMIGTRIMGGRSTYRHEMTDEQHCELLELLKQLQGMVMLSGYNSKLYNEQLKGWTKVSTTARACGQKGTVKRTECLWMNQNCVDGAHQADIFGNVEP